MRLLVSGSIRASADPRVGYLLTPRNPNSLASILATGLPWAADNGCYAGFDPAGFGDYLGRIAHQPRCLFVCVPDCVGNALGTLWQFWFWRSRVAAAGQPLAFVGQDGAEDLHVPWGQFAVWFIGGSTAWKLSGASADLAREAKARGKYIHMGRVNSLRRLQAAYDMGCDSVDGSSYSRWAHRARLGRPDMSLARHLAFIEQLSHEPTLWGYGADQTNGEAPSRATSLPQV